MSKKIIVTKKICLLGSFSVGKTSLVARFVRHTFSEKYLTTVGVKIDSKLIDISDEMALKLIIWDIAGVDKSSGTDVNYLRGSAGIFYVVDGTRKETLDSITQLKQIVNDKVGECAMVCAFNKADLTTKWEVNGDDIENLIFSGIPSFKTSAKTGENVEMAFKKLSSILI